MVFFLCPQNTKKPREKKLVVGVHAWASLQGEHHIQLQLNYMLLYL
jgi:hypothetical protein